MDLEPRYDVVFIKDGDGRDNIFVDTEGDHLENLRNVIDHNW